MMFASCTIVAAALLGWTDITVQPSRGENSSYQRTINTIDRPTERTVETLKRYALERRYRHDVDGTLAGLLKVARAESNPEVVYALAELSWFEAKRLDHRRRAAAVDYYIQAVGFAHDFLLDPDFADPRRASDPHFRLASEIYNAGFESLLRTALAKSNGWIAPESLPLKVRGQDQLIRVSMGASPWTLADVDKLLVAADYEVLGLPTRSLAQFGLGVPLIAVRQTDDPGKGEARFYPPEMTFPMTAFFVPAARLRDPAVTLDQPRAFSIRLLDPVKNRIVGPEPGIVTVEADLTTPLAYMWARTDLNRYRWAGLLRPGEAIERANLMLLRPYEPGKIPVVMVHGLVSSPLAWVPMLNELLRDPVVQERYQFLLYMYPTGVPIPIAAAGLRESLREAERLYNPGGRDPAFGQMVLLGHSMGGILSHMMAVESDDRFWQLNSDRRFEEIHGQQAVLDELRRYLFFHPLPFVREVVYLATPHRGSALSRGVVGRVGAGLITDLDHISDLLSQLIKDNPEAFDRRKFRRLPTSIETLAPRSPILETLLTMKPAPGVEFHSIIGSKYPGSVLESTDGVVPYTSAHLEGVASETLVRSDHGVQKDPEAIRQVRRILLEHIGVSPARPVATAAPATAARPE